MRALLLLPLIAACGQVATLRPGPQQAPAQAGPAIGSSQAQVSQALGIAGDTAQLPGGAVCVTYPDRDGGGGFTHAIFVNGQLSRLSDDNFVTCTGDFA
ncbi:MAG: hypothetical protein ACU0CI_10205 [Shimia sp.]